MDENGLIIRSKGFTQKSFIDLPDDTLIEILESNGVFDAVDDIEPLVENWSSIIQNVNNEIINSLAQTLDIASLERINLQDEVDKVAQSTGNTILYIYINILKKDWFQRITEYMVYVDKSIGSIAGATIYWMTIQCFLEEDGVSRLKGKHLLEFIVRKYEFIAAHKYYDEIETFAKTFPFKPLQLKEYNLMDIISLLELYPNGKLNRFISKHFPAIPQILSREKITRVLHKHVKSALNGFDAEKLWKEGNIDSIKDFLMESAIQKNRIANHEILQSPKADYIDTIKKWLHSQTALFTELFNIEQIKIIRAQDQNHETEHKIPAKYYALYHRILIDMKREKDFQRQDDDRYSRKEIEQFAQRLYPNINAQSFYRGFIELDDFDNKIIISRSFKNLKQKITTISENNPDVLHYLKQFPG